MTNLNLSEKSKNYYEENDIYEIFSIAEDYPNKIYNFLLPKIQGKTVLDLGCGTGKFMQKFYDKAHKYYGLDLSEKQLNIAKEKVKDSNNVEFMCCSAENIPLPDNSVDVIISTWVLGTILELDRRNKVLEEMNLPISEYVFLASSNSAGTEIEFMGKKYIVRELKEDSFDEGFDFAIFSAGGGTSKKFSPIAANKRMYCCR